MSVRRLFALTATTHITRTLVRRMVTTVLAGSPAACSSEPARGITAGSMDVLATVTAMGADTLAAAMALPDAEQLAVVDSEVAKRAAVAVSTQVAVSMVAVVPTLEAAAMAVVDTGSLPSQHRSSNGRQLLCRPFFWLPRVGSLEFWHAIPLAPAHNRGLKRHGVMIVLKS